jgi:TM2 domain-containing membrane protein YozV/RNA polymerase subunit RPABC4/transcription elongation factor Spt4
MTEQGERIKKENEKFCHECGELIRIRAEICPKCGSRQPFVRPVHAAFPSQKFCHECGEIIDGKAEICPKCGVRQPSYFNFDTISGNVLGQGQPRSRVAAGLLAILGGGLGLHRFYLGQPVWGIVYILLIWTGIPVLLGLIEGIYFLIIHEDEFQRKNAGPAWSSKGQFRNK